MGGSFTRKDNETVIQDLHSFPTLDIEHYTHIFDFTKDLWKNAWLNEFIIIGNPLQTRKDLPFFWIYLYQTIYLTLLSIS